MTKRPERHGQLLFINAINEVKRKNAQSCLEDWHIKRIATAYKNYCNDGDFARIATIQNIADNNFSLSISLYVKPEVSEDEIDNRTVQEHPKNYEFELPDMEKQRELAEFLWAMDATKKSYQN